MLCAASEIGAADDGESGILILGGPCEPGTKAASVLGIGAPVLELGITPNRGDCLSMRGVAREVSALGDETFESTLPSKNGLSAERIAIFRSHPRPWPLFRLRGHRNSRRHRGAVAVMDEGSPWGLWLKVDQQYR